MHKNTATLLNDKQSFTMAEIDRKLKRAFGFSLDEAIDAGLSRGRSSANKLGAGMALSELFHSKTGLVIVCGVAQSGRTAVVREMIKRSWTAEPFNLPTVIDEICSELDVFAAVGAAKTGQVIGVIHARDTESVLTRLSAIVGTELAADTIHLCGIVETKQTKNLSPDLEGFEPLNSYISAKITAVPITH